MKFGIQADITNILVEFVAGVDPLNRFEVAEEHLKEQSVFLLRTIMTNSIYHCSLFNELCWKLVDLLIFSLMQYYY